MKLTDHSDVQASTGEAKSPQKKRAIFLDSLDAPESRNMHFSSVD